MGHNLTRIRERRLTMKLIATVIKKFMPEKSLKTYAWYGWD